MRILSVGSLVFIQSIPYLAHSLTTSVMSPLTHPPVPSLCAASVPYVPTHPPHRQYKLRWLHMPQPTYLHCGYTLRLLHMPQPTHPPTQSLCAVFVTSAQIHPLHSLTTSLPLQQVDLLLPLAWAPNHSLPRRQSSYVNHAGDQTVQQFVSSCPPTHWRI